MRTCYLAAAIAAAAATMAGQALAQDEVPAEIPAQAETGAQPGADTAPQAEAPVEVMPQEAEPAETQVAAVWDPLETVNRAIWDLNGLYTSAVYTPFVGVYRDYIPQPVRSGVDNLFSNLREPVTMVSSAVIGDYENVGISAGRFAINLTAGIGGILDVATEMGWVARPVDLGTALCARGVPAGPYLVLPFIGSANLRDGAALAATYTATFVTLQDWAMPYIITDRAVARLTDPNGFSDEYTLQREAYGAFRTALCDGALPSETVKASPLGQTIPVMPEVSAPAVPVEAPPIELPTSTEGSLAEPLPAAPLGAT